MLKRLLNKRTFTVLAILFALAMVSGGVGLWVVLNSPLANEKIRQRAVQELEARTGGKASLESIRWSLRQQKFVLENLSVRGSEPESEPPFVHVKSITAGVNLRSLLQRRVDLFELTIHGPQFHITIDDTGKTNLPTPPARSGDQKFSVSIDSLKVVDGTAIVNERSVPLDLSIANMSADLTFRGAVDVLTARLTYDGSFTGLRQSKVPYTLTGVFDATRGTILVQSAEIVSGKSTVKLQGRLDDALTTDIAGRLDYTARIDPSIPSRYFPEDKIAGTVIANGALQFSRGSFATQGGLSASRLELNGREVTDVKSRYDYTYSSGELKLTDLSVSLLGGTISGTASTVVTADMPRFAVDVQYRDFDVAQLTDYYRWDPQYVVFSTVSGHAVGWIENRGAVYELNVDSELAAYTPAATPGVTPFPLSGTASFVARPGDIELKSSNIDFFDTSVQASGQVREMDSALTLTVSSRNLANLRFLYKDANGAGSFQGTAKGPLRTPILDGKVAVDGYQYDKWTIRHAEGDVVLDTRAKVAKVALTGTVGDTTGSVTGTASLDRSQVNLKLQSARVRAAEFSSLVGEKIDGIVGGEITITSIEPLRFSGQVRGSGLTARGETVDAAEGDVSVAGDVVEIRNLTASSRGARLTGGAINFNRATEAIDARGDIASLFMDRFRDFGIPDDLRGNVPRARLQVKGTLRKPLISGDAIAENLAFRDEQIPRAQLKLSTEWPQLQVAVESAGNIDLTALVNLSEPDHPFDATARFRNYSLERLSGFTSGTLTASGDVRLKGSMRKDAPVSGSGTIRSVRVKIGQYEFNGSQPFDFNFDANRLVLAGDTILVGARNTSITVRGSVGLAGNSRLELSGSGTVDLAVLAALDPSWSVTGRVAFEGRVGGTIARPTVDGIATLTNASLGREGIYTTLSGLNGNVRFRENRVTLDNVEGRASGGTVRFRGTGLLQNERMESLDVRIDVEQMRMRYPAGLRSTLSGTLVLKGTSTDPILDGNLNIDSMTYRSPFESFLAVFRPGGLNSGGTALDAVRLSVHIVGNRNISIQNELAEVNSARIDLDVKGTLGSPSLTGHVETDEGTLLFQGKRYTITRGNIDFVDPLRIDPVIDIQAETDLRDYRVILAVTGRGDRVRVDFNSDPPLPKLEVISLIAGGMTRDELAEQSGATSLPTSEQLFQGGAASILVDLLRSRVGSRFGLLGLDRVRIDPYLVGTGDNPSARITLSERVTKDLAVTYSQDLSSSQQRIIQIEYFLSKDLSIVASREENNEAAALGLDLRLRKRF
jgi:translocation and assembly module TamB